jgi:sugar phosphate isomerase/epimerase
VAEPQFSIGEYTTRRLSFKEDLAAYREAGADGIGIDAGLKLEGDESELDWFRESRLQATFCFATTPSILPLTQIQGTADPARRIEEICLGMEQLAPYKPIACACVTGPQGHYSGRQARDLAVGGLRDIARTAAALGMAAAVEPMHTSLRSDWSFVASIPETIDLLDETDEPNLGMIFDVWHLWDTPDLLRHTRQHADRFIGVQVDDWRQPTRSWCDRVLPGDGIADLPGIFAALDDGGYSGWFELEIFSDDGTFGNDFPDSLWKRDPVELIRAGREKFLAIWGDRHVRR